MSTKMIVLLGSPRKKGNSATLAQQVISGAKTVGAQVESFFLHGMDIRPCNACDACLKTAEPACVVEDDMPAVGVESPPGMVEAAGDAHPPGGGGECAAGQVERAPDIQRAAPAGENAITLGVIAGDG